MRDYGSIGILYKLILWISMWVVFPFSSSSQELDLLIDEPELLRELNYKARKFVSNQPDSAITLATEALEIATRLNRPLSQGFSYMTFGLAEMTLDNFSIAENHYSRALRYYREKGDSVAVSNALNQLGYANQALGFTYENLNFQLQSLKLREQFTDDPRVLASSKSRPIWKRISIMFSGSPFR